MELEDAIITTSYGDGIVVEEFKGTYGLVATTKGKEDVNYKVWVFLSEWSQKARGWVAGTVKRPMAVRLGSDPIPVIEQLIAELKKGGA